MVTLRLDRVVTTPHAMRGNMRASIWFSKEFLELVDNECQRRRIAQGTNVSRSSVIRDAVEKVLGKKK